MKKLTSLYLLIFISLCLFSTSAPAQKSIFDVSGSSLFSNDNEFLKVDDAFIFNFYQKENKLHISFDIAEGYYLYRHQFKISSATSQFSMPELPQGIDHEDEFFGVQQIYTQPLRFVIHINQADAGDSIEIKYQGCAKKGLCYSPEKKSVELNKVEINTIEYNADTFEILPAITQTEQTHSTIEKNNFATNNPPNSEQHRLAAMLKQDSLWFTLVAFFIGGLLLSLTPCVFPMYPILTGIIVGQGQQLTTKKAFSLSFVYVQGMAVTYTVLGVVVAMAGAKFQAAFQHPALLISLSVLFVFLALSMFGVFNLSLPGGWQNKLNNLSNKQQGGSVTGVLMMGVISGLVASPCTTAPLTGALLYISQTGDIVLGASALYALSLGMGLPLLILGSSGGKLLPKAGAWMNIIKNIFGLLLLAVPIFLLERLIPAIASQTLWVLLLLASASYFYVANQNSNNTKSSGFWYGVRALLIFLLMFWGANLGYQLISPNNSHNITTSTQHQALFKQVTNLSQLQQEIIKANKQGKTVMVDLYADWCVACKEFEKYTFSSPQVQQALKNTLWLQIDMTAFGSKENSELAEYYKIFGLPSILFFDLNGNELAEQRTTGFMGADEFTAHVKATLK